MLNSSPDQLAAADDLGVSLIVNVRCRISRQRVRLIRHRIGYRPSSSPSLSRAAQQSSRRMHGTGSTFVMGHCRWSASPVPVFVIGCIADPDLRHQLRWELPRLQDSAASTRALAPFFKAHRSADLHAVLHLYR
jgi:hypothetical protein